MNKTKFLVILAAIMLLVNVALVAYLFAGKPPGPPDRKKIIIEALHLDKAQQATYTQLVEQHRADIRNADAQIRELKNKLYIGIGKQDTAAADSLILAINHMQQQVEYIHYHHFEDIRKLCRAEQLQSFEQLAGNLSEIFSPKPPHPPMHERP